VSLSPATGGITLGFGLHKQEEMFVGSFLETKANSSD